MPTALEAAAGGVVVDASLVVAALVDAGPAGRWSEQILDRRILVAPELAVVEALNILRRLELHDQLTTLEAAAARADLQDLALELLPIRPFVERIWELRSNLTCYDAWYIAVAEAFELPLATLDLRLATASGPRCGILTPRKSSL